MSIKSDRWIRRMAAQGMIDPFEAGQVRVANGGRIVSYGTSSYGYDVRCANEFKIFTNINSTIVDPKDFDSGNFVDLQSDVCIIPPNSFALARTIEYFRIPRNVLSICMGKSTYARCVRGDTRVALVDGTAPTLEEMARRSESGELFWGYSIGAYGRLIVTLLERPRFIGRDALVEIVLDNAESVHATPDHVFLMRDGRTAPAGELRPGDSLMPLYRDLRRGHEMVYQPINGRLYPTHRLADEWNVRHSIYEAAAATHRHHLDRDRRNNRPTNLPEWAGRLSEAQAERAVSFWTDPRYATIRAGVLKARRNPSAATRELHRLATVKRYADPAGRLRQGGRSAAAWAPDDGSRRRMQREEVIRQGQDRGASRNHRIAAVRELPGDHDTYCLTVPEAGNFALEAGVFVRNCGIIVNVTPLEPEWEGHVTLEFSNTTPLPAKIYANEGVAQMLFLESDEVCETSYKDRGGKYQGQRGVTLPKA